jgi:hypothetical protein
MHAFSLGRQADIHAQRKQTKLCLAFWIGDGKNRVGDNMQCKTKKLLTEIQQLF